MWRVPDLARRVREPELMDDPSIDPEDHRRALAGLARLNRLGGAVGIVWNAIGPLAATPGHSPVSILDIGTGSGDIPLGLVRCARRVGAALSIHGCDLSEHALALAHRRFTRENASITTFCHDAVRDEIPGEYDVVMCSLLTHHLDDKDVIGLLYRMRAAARKLVLVSDLVRSRGAYRLACAAAHVLSRSRIVRTDAERSMRAAFTILEMTSLAEQAGLSRAEIAPRWPCRFLLTWRREQ